MAELPPGMLQGRRGPDPEFADDEELYRAFESDQLAGSKIALDAIDLPDMSVSRPTYGPPDGMLLLDIFAGCGVAVFKVEDIPTPLLHNGTDLYSFRPVHLPTANNYPHSEVRGFEPGGAHIQTREKLDAELHLRWRNRLRQ